MTHDQPARISDEEAEATHGITTRHEQMPNGELRFRLACSVDGSTYIRTVATSVSGWQRSHWHAQLREAYIVESGWMALAMLRAGTLEIRRLAAGEIVVTERDVAHNVFMPDRAVIHTVKFGHSATSDWHASRELDHLTRSLTAAQVQALANGSARAGPAERSAEPALDPRFGAYVDVYNNLDTLIWQVPGFFVAAAAIFFGFIASNLEKDAVPLPPAVWASVLVFTGLLFLIGAYSMHRLRLHHSRMGGELCELEPIGYFHTRRETVSRVWPPSAPHLFMVFFAALGVSSLAGAALMALRSAWLLRLLRP